MLKMTGAAVAGASILGLPIPSEAGTAQSGTTRKKALVIGAHPDDPETGCGGTIAVLKAAGWDVVDVYLTAGEAGIAGKSHAEAAAIRRQESARACATLGTRAVFLTQIDGSTEINHERYDEMRQAIAAQKPDVVFTHWPIDSHRDHRICSMLVYDAWRHLDHSFELFYFEVMTGDQTQLFQPTDWVNIDAMVDLKRKACYCHESQGMKDLYVTMRK